MKSFGHDPLPKSDQFIKHQISELLGWAENFSIRPTVFILKKIKYKVKDQCFLKFSWIFSEIQKQTFTVIEKQKWSYIKRKCSV